MRKQDRPLHAFCVVDLGVVTLALLPYPDCTIPASADKLEAGGTPIAAHDGSDMSLVDVTWRGEVPDVVCVEVVVFGCEEDGCREGR